MPRTGLDVVAIVADDSFLALHACEIVDLDSLVQICSLPTVQI